jgi:hypothetical protein
MKDELRAQFAAASGGSASFRWMRKPTAVLEVEYAAGFK